MHAAGQMIEFPRPDGQAARGWLVTADRPVGAVVVIQEWWGLNEQIRGVAARFARAGFTALVPDLYKGQQTVEAEEAHHLMSGLNFGEAASQDIRGAVQHLQGLKQGSGKVGVTGYCMGGALTVLALTQAPEAAAGVVWYGYPPLEYVDASRIQAPVQAHWATQDAFFALEGVSGWRPSSRLPASAMKATATWPTMPLPTRPPRAPAACRRPNTTRPGQRPPGTEACAFSGITWGESGV